MLCIVHICCVMCIGTDLLCPRWVEIKYYRPLSHQFPCIHAIFTFSHVFSNFGNGCWCSTYLPTCHKPVWTLVDGHLQLSRFKVCFQLTITFSRPILSPLPELLNVSVFIRVSTVGTKNSPVYFQTWHCFNFVFHPKVRKMASCPCFLVQQLVTRTCHMSSRKQLHISVIVSIDSSRNCGCVKISAVTCYHHVTRVCFV